MTPHPPAGRARPGPCLVDVTPENAGRWYAGPHARPTRPNQPADPRPPFHTAPEKS